MEIGRGFGGAALERVRELSLLLVKPTPEAEFAALERLGRGVIWSVFPSGRSPLLGFDDHDAPRFVKVRDRQGVEMWVLVWAVKR